jgi:hypothetical protein
MMYPCLYLTAGNTEAHKTLGNLFKVTKLVCFLDFCAMLPLGYKPTCLKIPENKVSTLTCPKSRGSTVSWWGYQSLSHRLSIQAVEHGPLWCYDIPTPGVLAEVTPGLLLLLPGPSTMAGMMCPACMPAAGQLGRRLDMTLQKQTYVGPPIGLHSRVEKAGLLHNLQEIRGLWW